MGRTSPRRSPATCGRWWGSISRRSSSSSGRAACGARGRPQRRAPGGERRGPAVRRRHLRPRVLPQLVAPLRHARAGGARDGAGVPARRAGRDLRRRRADPRGPRPLRRRASPPRPFAPPRVRRGRAARAVPGRTGPHLRRDDGDPPAARRDLRTAQSDRDTVVPRSATSSAAGRPRGSRRPKTTAPWSWGSSAAPWRPPSAPGDHRVDLSSGGADGAAETAVLDRAAIAGLGITETGKVYGRSATDFAVDAVRLAVADAGLTLDDVDGLLVSSNGISGGVDARPRARARAYGTSAPHEPDDRGRRHRHRPGAVRGAGGRRRHRHDRRVRPRRRAAREPAARPGDVYRARRAARCADGLQRPRRRRRAPRREQRLRARRPPPHERSTARPASSSARSRSPSAQWAAMQPAGAVPGADHARRPPGVAVGRRAAAPPRLLHGLQRRRRRAWSRRPTAPATSPQPPVHVLGRGRRRTRATAMARGSEYGLVTGRGDRRAGGDGDGRHHARRRRRPRALRLLHVHALVTLEDYGFCAKGEGGAVRRVAARSRPGGSLPTNTGGGQLSSFYLWGMTPLSEAVIQVARPRRRPPGAHATTS